MKADVYLGEPRRYADRIRELQTENELLRKDIEVLLSVVKVLSNQLDLPNIYAVET